MRTLLIADAAHTGFGRVGRELASRFLDAGHDIRWIAINWRGRAGEALAMLQDDATADAIKERLDEIDNDPLTARMVPAMSSQDGMGHRLTAPAVYGQLWPGWRPEVVLLVADPRAALYRLASDDGALGQVRTLNYVPIEGHGQPPFLAAMWEKVEPVAQSRYGAVQIEAITGQPVPFVPHGVSPAFFPVSKEQPGTYRGHEITSKEQAKAVMGWAGRRVILRTDRFIPRKNYGALFRSAAPVLATHPDALLVVHCSTQDEGGVMPELMSRMPGAFLGPTGWAHPQVRFTRAHDTFRGMSDADLNVLYNAADVLASTTMGEGWGLCAAEAAATGCPVVITDYSACPEVVGPGGLYARVAMTMTNVYACEWALVDEDDFTEKLEYVVSHPARGREIGEAGRRHVAQWTWDRSAQMFLDLMETTPVEQAA